MGRVAKYKKIKSFDPYSKKNKGQVNLDNVGVWGLGDNGRKAKKRSLKAQMMKKANNKRKRGRSSSGDNNNHGGGFDLPPGEKDEFDIRDMTGSVKKQKMINPILEADSKISTQTIKIGNGNGSGDGGGKSNIVATIPKTMEDERKVARVLNVNEQTIKNEQLKKETQAISARQEGESKNAYSKRTKAETRQIIKQSRKINEEKRQKKKEFLKNKKNKGKKNKFLSNNNNNNNGAGAGDDYPSDDNEMEDQNGGFVTGERAVAAAAAKLVDHVQFGEQAERPPSFRQLPRGAKKKHDAKSSSDPATAEEGEKSTGMTDTQVQAERDAMELLRRRVQAQYSAIKAQRRRAGDFHL